MRINSSLTEYFHLGGLKAFGHYFLTHYESKHPEKLDEGSTVAEQIF
jgi:hypothetical protein